jgi:hypothetical protein
MLVLSLKILGCYKCQVKTKVYPVEPKGLDYLQKFLLRVVAT